MRGYTANNKTNDASLNDEPIRTTGIPFKFHMPVNVTYRPDFATRANNIRRQVQSALDNMRDQYRCLEPLPIGSQNSQGDVTHRADVARTTFGINGTGVKIGVLSDGVISLAASQGLGDLGPVTILPGQAGLVGDEGTAMLEIIHDLAPRRTTIFCHCQYQLREFCTEHT